MREFITKKDLEEKKDERSILDYNFYEEGLKEDYEMGLEKIIQLTINQIIESDCFDIYYFEDWGEVKRAIDEYFWINLDNNEINLNKEEFEKGKKRIFEAVYKMEEE